MAAPIPREHVVKVHAELHNAVVVRPGDKLVYATTARLTSQQCDEVASQLGARLPGVDVVVASECSALAVYRDEPTGIERNAT